MKKTKPGRPRSEKARAAILEATEMLLKNEIAGLSIEAIARQAKVGKPTIYRWWPSLADIVLDVLLLQADAKITVPTGRPLAKSLGPFLQDSVDALNRGAGKHLRFLMAQAQKDQAFRERFRERFVSARRTVLKDMFDRAVDKAEIAPNQNTELLVDMVFGAMWYRLLTGHAPLDRVFAQQLAVAVIKSAGG